MSNFVFRLNKQGNEGKAKSYFQLARKEGIRGLYWGIIPTMWRDVPTFGVYFYSYDFLWKRLCDAKHIEEDTFRNIWGKMVAGGLAGQIIWTISYPIDVIKSYIQYHPEQHGMIKTGIRIYHRYGAGKFFKGLYPCLIRAFPVNALVFIFYEKSLQVLNNHF